MAEPKEYVIKLKDKDGNYLFPQSKVNYDGTRIPSIFYGEEDPISDLGEEGDIYFKV